MFDIVKMWPPGVQITVGLVSFYIGLKIFSGGFKALGDPAWLTAFTGNIPLMFIGGIVCTLAWQSSSLSTAAIVALVASGAVPLPAAIAAVLGANIGTTGTIWLAAVLTSDASWPTGTVKHIAMVHTMVNVLMGIGLLPFANQIAKFVERF